MLVCMPAYLSWLCFRSSPTKAPLMTFSPQVEPHSLAYLTSKTGDRESSTFQTTETDRQTDKQTDRQTDRQTDTDRQQLSAFQAVLNVPALAGSPCVLMSLPFASLHTCAIGFHCRLVTRSFLPAAEVNAVLMRSKHVRFWASQTMGHFTLCRPSTIAAVR